MMENHPVKISGLRAIILSNGVLWLGAE